jgi:hypothetical protein
VSSSGEIIEPVHERFGDHPGNHPEQRLAVWRGFDREAGLHATSPVEKRLRRTVNPIRHESYDFPGS